MLLLAQHFCVNVNKLQDKFIITLLVNQEKADADRSCDVLCH
jgi:hypothetical protein